MKYFAILSSARIKKILMMSASQITHAVFKPPAGAGLVPVCNHVDASTKVLYILAFRVADGHRTRPCKVFLYGMRKGLKNRRFGFQA